MSTYLIIDGYNIINKWPELIKAKNQTIEFAREKLNTIIQKYADFKNTKTTIVYDGAGREREKIEGTPQIIYSKGTETADAVIEYIVKNYETPGDIIVATDDNVQRNFIVTAGAWYMSAQDLENEVKAALVEMRKLL